MITISTVDQYLVRRTDESHLVDDLCHQVHEDPDLQTSKVGVWCLLCGERVSKT